MISSSEEKQVSDLIDRINSAWSTGHPEELEPCFDKNIVMVLPGFGGRAEGRAAVLSGFEDFCENAHIRGFKEIDRQVDVRGCVAVVSFGFDIEYERGLPYDLREGLSLNASSFFVLEEQWSTNGAQEFPFGVVVVDEGTIDEVLSETSVFYVGGPTDNNLIGFRTP